MASRISISICAPVSTGGIRSGALNFALAAGALNGRAERAGPQAHRQHQRQRARGAGGEHGAAREAPAVLSRNAARGPC